jgi:hypothetical protein
MALRFTEGGIMDVEVTALSEKERGALAELANMDVNRAAAGLRQILGEKVLLSVPPVVMNVACVERPVHWTRCESLTRRTRHKRAPEPLEVVVRAAAHE